MYDGGSHIVAYSLDFSKDRDFPLIGSASMDAGITTATIVHDFNYGKLTNVYASVLGIQYVLNRDAHVCHKVTPLDVKMGDVLVEDKEISLKSPNDLILHLASKEFYSAGKVVPRKIFALFI